MRLSPSVLAGIPHQAAEAKGFEEVRDQLMEEVYGGRIEQETEQWFEAARRKAAVQILLEPAAKP